MPLKPRYPGIRNSWNAIDPAALDTSNFDSTAGKPNPAGVTADDPRGALSGMVAVLKGAGIVGVADGTTDTDMDHAVGLYINNVLGDAFQSSSAVASGKAVYWDVYGVYETDVFELYADTDIDAGTIVSPLTYAVNDPLFCSPRSFITKDGTSDYTKHLSIGYVISPATPSNPFMTVCLRFLYKA